MNPVIAISLCVCLLLSACGSQPQDTQSTTTTTQAVTTAPVTESTPTATTAAPTTEATTAATTVPAPEYPHPLNGALSEEPWNFRPTAIVFNNIVDCLPQHGISRADIVYEYETEGGITRLLGIFSDLSGVGNIGPVRSSRSFFNSTAVAYSAPIIHCGGSEPGRNGQYSDNGAGIPNWAHIDEAYNGSYFFRDQARLKSGMAREHTLFTTGEKLVRALKDKGFDTPNPADTDYGLQFEESVALNGETASSVVITFRAGKTTTMTYNPATGLYEASQYKRSHIDGNTGEVVAYSNVLALYTDQWFVYDGVYNRSFYELFGSGSGYYACGGEIIPIRWHREDLHSPFTFTREDGTPLALAAGTTYVGVASDSKTIRYQ